MDISRFKHQIAQLAGVNTLKQQSLDALFDSMNLLQLSRGDKLFTEGQEDKWHYYLLEGSLSIRSRLSVPHLIEAGSPEALRPIDHFQPRKHTATAKANAICLRIDSPSLEMMLSWEQSGDYEVEEIGKTTPLSVNDWMGRLLKNPIFQKLPPDRLQLLFSRFTAESYKQGDILFAQGESGERFYVIASGRVAVLRSTPKTPNGTPVAQLNPGDTFGEDSLLSHQPRNASIQALEDCQLMWLSKDDFLEIIQKPLTSTVDFMEAADLVSRNKAKWIDVRLPSEYSLNHLDSSINLPFLFMRLKVTQLDQKYHYIVYCENGEQSTAGAYLLKKNGLDARVLEGGLQSTSIQ